MSNADPLTLTALDFAAAIEWWRDAGVDCDLADDATDWLAEPVQAEPAPQTTKGTNPVHSPAEAPPPQKIDLLGPNPPADLSAFHEWWLTEPELDAIGLRGRVPPRGPAGARLMVLVMDPEQGDTERLLSQAQGQLLSRILGAMGIAEDQVYLASALPRHTPMADGAALAAQGFSKVLQHHIRLAAPQRLLAFGTNILPLLGHDAAQEPASLQNFNHEGYSVPLMASEGLDAMMAMPRLKARFWHRWLEWTGSNAQ